MIDITEGGTSMTNAQIVKSLVNLEPDLDVLEVEEVKKNGKSVKIIHISNSKKRVRCPYCKKYTRNVHDKLKPITVKYLTIAGYTTYLKVYKRRFNCNNCGKRFTEDNFINDRGKNISLKLEQKVLLDLMNYNLSMSYIARSNNISDNKVRSILKQHMKSYPETLKNLPSIISFDEFKADTRKENMHL